MVEKIQGTGQAAAPARARQQRNTTGSTGDFGAMLQQKTREQQRAGQTINFSKHALERAEQRGIALTPALMDKLAGSVEKAQEKGANTILAIDATQAFIISIPYGRVITTMSQEEMKENVFTNIDGAVLL